MSFDNTCKFLAENFSADIATWLLGTPIQLTKLEPSELFVEPIRADAVIFMESEDLLLHVEFQTDPDPEIGFRVTDYRLRGFRRYPNKQMRQIVVYLRPTQSERVYQTHFELPGLRHEFEVVRLWEQPTELFLSSPGLLPFAVLSQTTEREQVLREVARKVEEIEDKRSQSNVAAASAILAGLLLKKDLIHRVLRSDIMRESVIYQEIEAEAEARGEARGEAKGELNFALRLLTRRIGTIAPQTEAQIRSLSLTQIEELGEALLDFSQPSDLSDWLRSHS
ncbi:MAG: Rpn family recombination-promoting nuclease/putative transposase [Acaryochloridaceae cyanobacterium RU_4_10]|nr:Rpn family recombination-promoting nuclease/putative transposase [Acaryochloridaceae cyanobacterium RU_4_10]